jgi:hypothetical protein
MAATFQKSKNNRLILMATFHCLAALAGVHISSFASNERLVYFNSATQRPCAPILQG